MAGRNLPKALTEEQVQALLDQVEGGSSMALRNRAMLTLMADGGLRLDEVLSLQTRDLKEDRGEVTALHLTHTKGDWQRVVPLTARARDALARWRERRKDLGLPKKSVVFTTLSTGTRRFPKASKDGFVSGTTEEKQIRPGAKIRARYVRDLVKRLADRAGLPDWVHPHTLRHSAAMRLYHSTGDIEVVRKFLGHRAVTTTQIYAEADDEQVKQAVAALDVAAEPEPDAETLALAKALAKALVSAPAEVKQALVALTKASEEAEDSCPEQF